ncbi:MAG: M23 family metallopeptidase [Firmicutes bacterium]|nr:M23 family metallopeptidase [Bacillota bacterium]
MHKKSSLFPFILVGIVLISGFFFLPSFILPEEIPEKQAGSPIPETPEIQGDGEKAEPAVTPPVSQQTNPGNENNLQEAGREEIIKEENGGNKTSSSTPETGTVIKGDENMLEKLSFLQNPLPGASVTTMDSQLPGAPRPYRHGVHEGLDFYSGCCGIQVNYGDPVFAAGPGTISRIDHGFTELPVKEREAMLQRCKEEGDTPETILDKLRGRQVWITHPTGLVTRYAHLSKVAEYLQEGDRIEAGDYLGDIGNSGTSAGAAGRKDEPHLHFEIWLEGSYLGKGLSPRETRSLLKTLLEKGN